MIPNLSVAGVPVFLGDTQHETVIVKIYEAPGQMPDTLLIGRLSHYGKVLSPSEETLAAKPSSTASGRPECSSISIYHCHGNHLFPVPAEKPVADVERKATRLDLALT